MLREALTGILATIIAIILHELSHGLAALALGDGTARRAGRLTLNPLAHVDRFGTLLLPALLAVSQLATMGRVAFMFGWAKPVPVNAAALHWGSVHNPRRLMALVAVAGPLMNFALAYAAALALRGGVALDFLSYFILINLLLGLFNLIPLPPMDGGRIAVGLLPLGAARWLAAAEKYGIVLVLLIVFILPAALAPFGIWFNPVQDGLNIALPWAEHLLLQMAGAHQTYGA